VQSVVKSAGFKSGLYCAPEVMHYVKELPHVNRSRCPRSTVHLPSMRPVAATRNARNRAQMAREISRPRDGSIKKRGRPSPVDCQSMASHQAGEIRGQEKAPPWLFRPRCPCASWEVGCERPSSLRRRCHPRRLDHAGCDRIHTNSRPPFHSHGPDQVDQRGLWPRRRVHAKVPIRTADGRGTDNGAAAAGAPERAHHSARGIEEGIQIHREIVRPVVGVHTSNGFQVAMRARVTMTSRGARDASALATARPAPLSRRGVRRLAATARRPRPRISPAICSARSGHIVDHRDGRSPPAQDAVRMPPPSPAPHPTRWPFFQRDQHVFHSFSELYSTPKRGSGIPCTPSP